MNLFRFSDAEPGFDVKCIPHDKQAKKSLLAVSFQRIASICLSLAREPVFSFQCLSHGKHIKHVCTGGTLHNSPHLIPCRDSLSLNSLSIQFKFNFFILLAEAFLPLLFRSLFTVVFTVVIFFQDSRKISLFIKPRSRNIWNFDSSVSDFGALGEVKLFADNELLLA